VYDVRSKHYRASINLIQRTLKDTKPFAEKSTGALEFFLRKNPQLYPEDALKNVRYFFDAFLYKFQLANISLEQLWSIRDAKVENNIIGIARNSIVSLELTNNEVILQSHVFEQFLFQSRSCLDFYMLYLAHFLRTGHKGPMSTAKFYKRLSRAEPDFLRIKARLVEEYFISTVFGEEKYVDVFSPTNWGSLLKSLRDKIAHRDRINMSMNSPDRIMNDILLDFPTLKDLTYDRFCQAMQNGMWFMICDLFPILYDLEWQAGPYREGMFD